MHVTLSIPLPHTIDRYVCSTSIPSLQFYQWDRVSVAVVGSLERGWGAGMMQGAAVQMGIAVDRPSVGRYPADM